MREIINKTKDEMKNSCFCCMHFDKNNDDKYMCEIDTCDYKRTSFAYVPKEERIVDILSKIPDELRKNIEAYKDSYAKMKEGKEDHYFDCVAEGLINGIHRAEKTGKITEEVANALFYEYNNGGKYLVMDIGPFI